MFFKQVYRNAAKNRKGNGLFFGSLAIAVIAFYTLLSLGEQDVMRFLSTIESDAVEKLMRLLPVVYVLSLFFVFFLVYFACSYQTDSRRKEFGLYLMMGMKRGRMFLMLFLETLWSSVLSIFIGLPAALLLTEGISLGTAKLVGLGILAHRFSFSPVAVLWTVCGFILVQLVSMFLICIPLAKREPADFLRGDAAEKQSETSAAKSSVFFIIGVILLIAAYFLGVFRLRYLDFSVPILVVAGVAGTFFLYRGLGGFLGKRIRKKAPDAKGLDTFTGRQVQESVLHQHKALAVSSLLLLLALSCASYGISLGFSRGSDSRSADFSLLGGEAEVSAVLEREEVKALTKTAYPVYLSIMREEFWDAVDPEGINEALRSVDGGERLVQNLHWEYVIAQSGYNHMREAMGKEPLELGEDRVALFSSMGNEGDFYSILDRATQRGASVKIRGKEYTFVPGLCYDNIVADRAITLYTAMIVPDALFSELARDQEPFCYNMHLRDDIVEEMGLMQAIQEMDGYLSKTGLEYDSYLSGIGRNLFYTVSASYLTIYLGILFLLIANTVIGLKYLMGHRQNMHRYQTLLLLGADTEGLCASAKKQISQFFFLVLGVAALSSIVAIISMFTGLTKLPLGTSLVQVAMLAGISLAVFFAIEIAYVTAVKRTACREIRQAEEGKERLS